MFAVGLMKVINGQLGSLKDYTYFPSWASHEPNLYLIENHCHLLILHKNLLKIDVIN